MALIIVHDPYEWFDPEVGRQGMLVHTSALDRAELKQARWDEDISTEELWRRMWDYAKGT